MARYSKKTQEHVGDTLHREKEGKLRSGSGQKVKSRKQAIAIALSEAREKGYKVPAKKAAKKSARKSAKKGAKKSATKKAAKRPAVKKRSAKKAAKKK